MPFPDVRLLWLAATGIGVLVTLAAVLGMGHAAARAVLLRSQQTLRDDAREAVGRCLLAQTSVAAAAETLGRLPAAVRAEVFIQTAARAGALPAGGDVRVRAAQLASAVGLTPWAVARARSRWWKRRLIAVRLLAAVVHTHYLPALARDTHPRVRAAAVVAMTYQHSSDGTFRVHIADALDDDHGLVRAVAREALAALGTSGMTLACEVVDAHLLDGDRTRRAALEALVACTGGPVQEESDVQTLFRASNAVCPAVRAAAVTALGAAGVTPAAGQDPAPEVRVAWARSAGRTRDLKHLPALLDALADPDPSVRRSAGAALLAYGDLGVAALRHAPEHVAEPAGRVLEQSAHRHVSWSAR